MFVKNCVWAVQNCSLTKHSIIFRWSNRSGSRVPSRSSEQIVPSAAIWGSGVGSVSDWGDYFFLLTTWWSFVDPTRVNFSSKISVYSETPLGELSILTTGHSLALLPFNCLIEDLSLYSKTHLGELPIEERYNGWGAHRVQSALRGEDSLPGSQEDHQSAFLFGWFHHFHEIWIPRTSTRKARQVSSYFGFIPVIWPVLSAKRVI